MLTTFISRSNNRDELLPEKGAVDDEEGTGRLGGIIGPVVSVAVAPRVEGPGEANPTTPGVVGVRMKAEGRHGFVNAMREAQVKAFNDFLLQACTERMSLLEHKESHLAEWASRFEEITRQQEQARQEAFQLALINMESSFQQQAALVQRGCTKRLEAERERIGKEARQEVLNSGLVEDTVQGRTTDLDGQLAVTRVVHKELEALVLERSGMVEKLRVERTDLLDQTKALGDEISRIRSSEEVAVSAALSCMERQRQVDAAMVSALRAELGLSRARAEDDKALDDSELVQTRAAFQAEKREMLFESERNDEKWRTEFLCFKNEVLDASLAIREEDRLDGDELRASLAQKDRAITILERADAEKQTAALEACPDARD
ncbi:hypothetical protein H257_12657 [Aphanomyces astaci]|uniref:Uncharacterized protein n=1 Tax=Aphanomyces astaci TaxID=112090 RepID=W4FYX0_APHAT|nr:hypothetical protein H257_12657 [Aphanomyces astaci]ETV72181.1 hypothetical protein H257_12657 [Aphanomyces astaci]|eukprot:XP_009838249.1 hypothetical protein H257_12657 [Aphanomyces astaci]